MDTDDRAETPNPQVELGRAVRTLTTALSEDPDFRRSWTANIAMAFFDEVRRTPQFSNDQGQIGNLTHDRLHEASNKAAEHFLDLLCMDNEKPETKGSHSCIMDQKRRTRVLRDVQAERDKQDSKWGQQNIDPFKFMAILMEEVGESSNAAIESFDFKANTWDHEKLKHYREELVQTAAVAHQAVECIDRGFWDWKPEERT